MLGASLTSEILLFSPDGLSLKWYKALVEKQELQDAFIRSIWVAIICVFISLLRGPWRGLPSKVSITQGRFDSDLSPVTFTIPLIDRESD